jgi:hypothetical protein
MSFLLTLIGLLWRFVWWHWPKEPRFRTPSEQGVFVGVVGDTMISTQGRDHLTAGYTTENRELQPFETLRRVYELEQDGIIYWKASSFRFFLLERIRR